MEQDQTIVTQNLMRFCYTCDHAHGCDTEEMSKQCWSEQDFAADAVAEEDMTAELLRQYAM
ncbi:MAG: hypothetical protein K0R57_3981 [Paenibacillaceae bacterium]|jgi:hypothetical protein|nr:hypothetical protein [Paenibacillaceae bacterium]